MLSISSSTIISSRHRSHRAFLFHAIDCRSTTVPLGGTPSLNGLQLRKICEIWGQSFSLVGGTDSGGELERLIVCMRTGDPGILKNSLTAVTGVFNRSWHFDWIFLRLRSSEFTNGPRNSICWEGTSTDLGSSLYRLVPLEDLESKQHVEGPAPLRAP